MIAYLENASKTYKTGDTTITALEPTNLQIQEGELLLIIGPSGSGKTTLLSLLGCVIYPSSGKVVIDGVDTTNLSDREMAAIRLKIMGFVFQNFNLVTPLTAEDNIRIPLQLQGIPTKQANEAIDRVLDIVKMGHRRKSLPRQLSGGEQQRIAIARALVTNPKMMLCDEPTASLDPKSVDIVMQELRHLTDEGRALVIVTHDQRLRPFADRIIEVSDGKAKEVPLQPSSQTH